MEMILIRERLWPVICERKVRSEKGTVDKSIKDQLNYDNEAERATATVFLRLSDAPLRRVMTLRGPVIVWAKRKDLTYTHPLASPHNFSYGATFSTYKLKAIRIWEPWLIISACGKLSFGILEENSLKKSFAKFY